MQPSAPPSPEGQGWKAVEKVAGMATKKRLLTDHEWWIKYFHLDWKRDNEEG